LKKKIKILNEKYIKLENEKKEKDLEIENLKKEIENLKNDANENVIEENEINEKNNAKNDVHNNEINIKYKLKKSEIPDVLKCNKYIKINKLKELIGQKKNINIKNMMLIFLGLEMNDENRLNDYQICNYKEETKYLLNKFDLNKKIYAYSDTRKLKLNYYDKNIVIYTNSFEDLQRFINIHFHIPQENQLIFCTSYNNHKVDETNFGYLESNNIKLQSILDYENITINILYNDNLKKNK
jgi:hypothetical protein